MTHPNSTWTPERDSRLTELWPDKELSTAEIGKRLDVSKNAVIGRARRIGLPARPSPIRTISPEGRARYARKRREASLGFKLQQAFEAKRDLGVIADEFQIPLERVKALLWSRGVRISGSVQPASRKVVRMFREKALEFKTHVNGGQGLSHSELTPRVCQFPISDDKPWRFCGCKPIEGKPYCPDHHAVTNTPYIAKEKPIEFIFDKARAA